MILRSVYCCEEQKDQSQKADSSPVLSKVQTSPQRYKTDFSVGGTLPDRVSTIEFSPCTNLVHISSDTEFFTRCTIYYFHYRYFLHLRSLVSERSYNLLFLSSGKSIKCQFISNQEIKLSIKLWGKTRSNWCRFGVTM